MKQILFLFCILFANMAISQADTTAYKIDFKVSTKAKKKIISQTVVQDDGSTVVTTFPEMDSTQFEQWKTLNLSYQDSVQLYVSKEIDRIESQQSYIEELKKQNQKALRELKLQAIRSNRIRNKLLIIK